MTAPLEIKVCQGAVVRHRRNFRPQQLRSGDCIPVGGVCSYAEPQRAGRDRERLERPVRASADALKRALTEDARVYCSAANSRQHLIRPPDVDHRVLPGIRTRHPLIEGRSARCDAPSSNSCGRFDWMTRREHQYIRESKIGIRDVEKLPAFRNVAEQRPQIRLSGAESDFWPGWRENPLELNAGAVGCFVDDIHDRSTWPAVRIGEMEGVGNIKTNSNDTLRCRRSPTRKPDYDERTGRERKSDPQSHDCESPASIGCFPCHS